MHIMPARKLVCVLRVYMYGVWHADGMRDRQTGHGGGATLPAYPAKPILHLFGVLQLIAAIAGDNEGPFGAYQLSSSVMVSVFIKKFQF